MVSSYPPTSQLSRDHTITVGRPFKSDALNGISEFHLGHALCSFEAIFAITVKGRTREADPLNKDTQILCPGGRSFLHMFSDKLKHPVSPVSFLYRAFSSSDAKTFFKKSFSIVSLPTIRSSSARRAASVYRLPLPANARSLYFICRCIHFEIVLAATWCSRAAAAWLLPASTSRITWSLKSRVNTLRLSPIKLNLLPASMPDCVPNFLCQSRVH